MSPPILEAHALEKRFAVRRHRDPRARRSAATSVLALDGVTLHVDAHEIVGVVGESGCGKSTLARIVCGLSTASGGSVRYRGEDVGSLDKAKRLRYTLAVQMVFQNPFAALNPRHRVSRIVGEALMVHGLVPAKEHEACVVDQLARVGLPADSRDRYPHQFSGGQRQRIGIARALAVNPEVLVCDEVVSALDVSIQAQILNLLLDLRASLGLGSMFISHDLGVIRYLCDRIAVMYLGRIVEEAPARTFFSQPAHPYAVALLAELPAPVAGKRRFEPIRGEIPSPIDPPAGCHFHPRCPHAFDRCRVEQPVLREIAPGHRAACHLHDRP
ncbi:MAG: ATP-binding cassette domain-containing protein [Burkholderiales bacterium]|nr:ATP-binding cassette domain-containing protein [Burkholderiales bacterium]